MLVEAAREDLVYDSYAAGRIFGETANRLTFFAYAIRDVFSEAKFIHLVRNPCDVVRSGMDRDWYVRNPWDEGRIIPRSDDPYQEYWETFSPFEKCVWLWQETNRFAQTFLSSLPSERSHILLAEDLFSGDMKVICSVFDFLEIQHPEADLVCGVLDRRENYQHERTFPEIQDWTLQQNQRLEQIAGPLMRVYGYD